MRYLILCLILSLSIPAQAACDMPVGVEGEIIYNRKHKVMQYCDGAIWWGMGWRNMPMSANTVFSRLDDLSDIQTYWDVSNNSKTVILVDVTGAGYLLGGEIRGYYPTDMDDNNYRVEITVDGAAPVTWPPGPKATHYYNDATPSANQAAITLPYIAFQDSLKIRYKVHEDTTRVHGFAMVKQ